MTRRRGSLGGDLIRGAIAGGVATWVMDQVTTAMLQSQSDEETEREEAARPNGTSTIGNLLDRIEERYDLSLDDQAQTRWSSVIHYLLGIVPGALYGALRGRVPFVGAWRGVLYGLVLWAVNDEYANSRLGLAGPWGAYPTATHLRGAVGHAVLGATTDTGIDILGG